MAKSKQERLLINDTSFEDAMSQMEAIVKQLERGELSLEQSLEQFEKGVKLSQMCLAKLTAAEKQITKVIREENGQVVERPILFGEVE